MKNLLEHDLRFVEEQLCSIVIEFLFVAKQNKTVFGCYFFMAFTQTFFKHQANKQTIKLSINK